MVAPARPAPAKAPETPGGRTPLRPRSGFARWHVPGAPVEEQEGWLVTYLDMITLLLVMLVVMLAFAGKGDGDGDGDGSGQGAANLAATASLVEPPLPPVLPEPVPALASPSAAEGAAESAESAGEEDAPGLAGAFGDGIEVIVGEHSVSFRISSELLFASGQAELADAGLDVLDQLIPTLAGSDHALVVEGHTDDRPIQTARFPSNWELSASRASSVVRYLQFNGIAAARLSATGYADTRPLADNADDAGRARNRRVELILRTQPAPN